MDGNVDLVIFDLDGTLIDSRRDLATAVNRVRLDRGLAPLAAERVEAMVGWGAAALVERALGDELAPALLPEALQAFLAHYEACCLETTRPYPGIPRLLERLAGGYPLGLLTNKPGIMTRRLLDRLGLAGWFAEVVAGDTLEVRKPHPQTVSYLARALGAEPARLLLVGDSAVDAETAAAAGCRLALVAWGFGDAGDLAAFGPELLAASPDALADYLMRLV